MYVSGIHFSSVSTIFLLDFGTVLTVLYFSIGFWNSSDRVVFFFSFYNRLFTRGMYVSVIYQNDMHMYIFITCLKYIHFFWSYFFSLTKHTTEYNTMQLSNINM